MGFRITSAPFGEADLFTLTNARGMEVRAMTYGCAIVSIRVPDRHGKLDDVVLGFDTLEEYKQDVAYLGVVVGRYANRIANAQFTLDGIAYRLAANIPPHHLHGGLRGFDKAIWKAETSVTETAASIVFRHTSPDGDEGYPGKLDIQVTYTLNDDNALSVEYRAATDKATPVNLSQHAYFNLEGEGSGSVLDHTAWFNANRYTPVTETVVPTGAIAHVEGTPFDFRQATPIGTRIGADHEQIRLGTGYDHNFVVNGPGIAARFVAPRSGRTLEVTTTEPGFQFYTANHLGTTGKSGHRYPRHSGFCIETQHFPDSPNHPEFPSTILRPGQEYRSRSIFIFGVAP